MATSGDLIDEESLRDDDCFTDQEKVVGIEEWAQRCMNPHRDTEDPSEGEVCEGFTPITIAGISCHSHNKQPQGEVWYGDGSQMETEVDVREVHKVGGGIACGPLQIVIKETGTRHIK